MSLVIAQITDLHCRPEGATALGFVPANTLARRAVEAIRALEPRPHLVLVTGDVTDLGEPAAYEAAREILSRLPMPVLVMPGNHDRREAMRAAFADWPGIAHADGPRLNAAVELERAAVVVLDSLVEGRPHGKLGDDQLAWLDATLERFAEKPVLIAVHHPPLVSGIAHMDAIALADREALAEVIARHRQVDLVVAGHVHRQIAGRIANARVLTIPGTAHQVALDLDPDGPPHFVMEPPAYALHVLTEEGFASHLAYVERHDGPHAFRRAPGVVWPGYPDA